jgi:hypothetical protein
MKTILNKIPLAMLFIALLFSSCKKEEKAVSPPVPGNEFLTTVRVRFQNTANANDTCLAIWKDVSQGANPPDTSKAIITLKKGSTYKAVVSFYDETKNPLEEVKIKDKPNYHSYWFFQTGAIVGNVTITKTDLDTNNPPLPIGLQDNFVTASPTGTLTTGRLEGVLRHQPNAKDGTFAPGSTDSDVFFTLNIIP